MARQEADYAQGAADDEETVIDVTDGSLARLALYEEVLSLGPDGELVIDLRDDDLISGTRPPLTGSERINRSGRPYDLLEGLRLVRLSDSSGTTWNKAEEFVYRNYRQLGYCEASPRNRVEELAAWTDRNTFHVVLDEDDAVVGTARLIHGNYEELPIGRFARHEGIDPDPVAELSSVVVQPDVRGMSVVAHLCRSVFFETLEVGANALVFLLEDGLIQLLSDYYGLPVRRFDEPHQYMGGAVAPSGFSMDGRDFLNTARVNPRYWQWMTEYCTAQQVSMWELPIVLVDEELSVEVGHAPE